MNHSAINCKCCQQRCAKNTFWVSGVNSMAAKTNIMEVNGNWFFKTKKKTTGRRTEHSSVPLLWCHPSVWKQISSESCSVDSNTIGHSYEPTGCLTTICLFVSVSSRSHNGNTTVPILGTTRTDNLWIRCVGWEWRIEPQQQMQIKKYLRTHSEVLQTSFPPTTRWRNPVMKYVYTDNEAYRGDSCSFLIR